MSAIAISKREEEQIERLRRELRIPTKSGVIRAALKTLEAKVEEEFPLSAPSPANCDPRSFCNPIW